jgi:hypothetical protein
MPYTSRGSKWDGGGRARLRQCTLRVEARSLSLLAATANAKLACAVQNMAGLEAVHAQLEFTIIEHACNSFEPQVDCEPDLPMPPMRIDDAVEVLRLHRYSTRGLGEPLRPFDKPPSIEDVQVAIAKKVAALRRGQAAGLKFKLDRWRDVKRALKLR